MQPLVSQVQNSSHVASYDLNNILPERTQLENNQALSGGLALLPLVYHHASSIGFYTH